MFKKISVLFFGLLMVLFSVQPAKAATLNWEPMVNSTFTGNRAPGFGDTNNVFTLSMVTFNDYVYVSNYNIALTTGHGTEIWRSNNGTDWEQVNEDNFGDASTAGTATLGVLNDNLYAFNWLMGDEHVDVYRYNSGTSWTNTATIGNGQTLITEPTAAIEYDNTLYISLVIDVGGNDRSAIYGSTDGTTWASINSDGFSDANEITQSLEVYNNYLYAGAYNAASGTEIWRYDGTTWVQDNNDGFDGITNVGTGSLTSFNGSLYASTTNTGTGSEVWATTGVGAMDWEKVSNDGFGLGAFVDYTMDSTVFKNKLYFGTISTDGAKVFRTADGSTYEQVNDDGFGYADNLFAIFAILGDYLYAGTGSLSFPGEFDVQPPPDTTEIYRYYEATPATPIEALPQTGTDNLNGYILDAIL